MIENSNIDYALVFEGENIIYPLVRAILDRDKDALNNIKNVYHKNEQERIIFNGLEEINTNMDNLPIVDFDIREYSDVSDINLDIGRGCPFNCYFCSTNFVWQRIPRFKSPERIVDEAEFYYNKIKHKKKPLIHFTHDNYLVDKKIIKEIIRFKEIKKSEFKYACTTRIDLIDDEIIELLDRSSCVQVFFGIESGSQKIQKISKKNINLKDVIPKIKKLTDKGIFVETNYIIGFPEETIEDVFDTFNLMAKVRWINPSMSAIDANLMAPVLQSYLGMNTKSEDYIFNNNERNSTYKDLIKIGIDVKSYNKEFHTHYYTIRNQNYDIVEMGEFTSFYIGLLSYFPVTMYIAMNKHKCTIKNIYDLFNEYKVKIQDKKEPQKYYFWIKNLFLENTQQLYKDILEFENIRAMSINKMILEESIIRFSYEIQKIYQELKYNPNIILTENYKMKPTKLKIKKV